MGVGVPWSNLHFGGFDTFFLFKKYVYICMYIYIYIYEFMNYRCSRMIYFAISLYNKNGQTAYVDSLRVGTILIEVPTPWGNLGHGPDRAGGAFGLTCMGMW